MEILKSFGRKKIGYLYFDSSVPFDSFSLACRKSNDCYTTIHYAEDGGIIT